MGHADKISLPVTLILRKKPQIGFFCIVKRGAKVSLEPIDFQLPLVQKSLHVKEAHLGGDLPSAPTLCYLTALDFSTRVVGETVKQRQEIESWV